MRIKKIAKISLIIIIVLVMGGCSGASGQEAEELEGDAGEIVETATPTEQTTPTVSQEQIEREEILERLKTRNLALTDEEMKEVMPFDDNSVEDLITSMRKYLYHDMPFVYIIFTDNDNAGVSRFSPFNFPQIDALVDFDLHEFDNEDISYFLTALTSKHIIEGWEGQINNPVYVTKDADGNICFGLRQSEDTEGIGFIKNTDGSYKYIDFNNPSDTRSLTNEEVKAFDGHLTVRRNSDGTITSLCSRDDLIPGSEETTTPTQEVTPTVAE